MKGADLLAFELQANEKLRLTSDILVNVLSDLTQVFYLNWQPVEQLAPPFGASIRPVGC